MLLIMLLSILAPMQGDAARQEPETMAAKPKPDPDKLICIRRVRTGSRTNFEQVCHTQAEWDLIRSENRKVIERGQASRGLKGT